MCHTVSRPRVPSADPFAHPLSPPPRCAAADNSKALAWALASGWDQLCGSTRLQSSQGIGLTSTGSWEHTADLHGHGNPAVDFTEGSKTHFAGMLIPGEARYYPHFLSLATEAQRSHGIGSNSSACQGTLSLTPSLLLQGRDGTPGSEVLCLIHEREDSRSTVTAKWDLRCFF